MPDAKVVELGVWIGSMTLKPVMPLEAKRYTSLPSKPEYLPAE